MYGEGMALRFAPKMLIVVSLKVDRPGQNRIIEQYKGLSLQIL
jgi:hypothetical protein